MVADASTVDARVIGFLWDRTVALIQDATVLSPRRDQCRVKCPDGSARLSSQPTGN